MPGQVDTNIIIFIWYKDEEIEAILCALSYSNEEAMQSQNFLLWVFVPSATMPGGLSKLQSKLGDNVRFKT